MIIDLKNWLQNYDVYNQYIIGYTPTNETKKILFAMAKTGTKFVSVKANDKGINVTKLS
jgi:hypothetical protein